MPSFRINIARQSWEIRTRRRISLTNTKKEDSRMGMEMFSKTNVHAMEAMPGMFEFLPCRGLGPFVAKFSPEIVFFSAVVSRILANYFRDRHSLKN